MLDGEWLTNNQPIVNKGLRLAHFVSEVDEESYCGKIHISNLTLDLKADRPCMLCLLYLFRDGYLHFRERVPRKLR